MAISGTKIGGTKACVWRNIIKGISRSTYAFFWVITLPPYTSILGFWNSDHLVNLHIFHDPSWTPRSTSPDIQGRGTSAERTSRFAETKRTSVACVTGKQSSWMCRWLPPKLLVTEVCDSHWLTVSAKLCHAEQLRVNCASSNSCLGNATSTMPLGPHGPGHSGLVALEFLCHMPSLLSWNGSHDRCPSFLGRIIFIMC